MKRIAVAAVSIVALLAILIAALPYVVPGGFLRNILAVQIAAWTGRTVTVSGEPRLSIYPELAISVDDLTVSNPNGLNEEAFIAAEGVRASVRPLPLLVGRVVFEEVELISPRFRLIVAQDGSTNWRMDASSVVKYAEDARRRAAEQANPDVIGENVVTPVLPDPGLGRLRIVDGIILYDDLASDHREEMDAVDISVRWPNAPGAASATGSLQWRGERFKFNGLVAKPLALIAGGTSPVRFKVASTIVRGSFEGEATAEGQLQLNGRAVAMTPSLRRAIEWSGTPMGTGAILSRATIEGSARWAGQALSFDGATVDIDGNTLTGDLALVAGARLALSGTVATERLDMTPYLEAARADLTAESSWLLKPTQLDFAEALDADLKITAKQAIIGTTALDAITAGLTTRDGAISLDLREAHFHDGVVTARLGAGMVNDELVAGLEADISKMPADAALTDLFGVKALRGTAATTISVSSRGETWGEFARALGGTTSLQLASGSLDGIDVIAIARALDAPDAGPIETVGGRTHFSSLSATIGIAGGSLVTSDLRMTGPGYSLELSGKGSVVTGSVEGTADIVRPFGRVAVSIGGRWRAPVVARQDAPEAPGQATTQDAADVATGG